MSIKAHLRIVLLADDVVVAESGDAELWQELLGRITSAGDARAAGLPRLSHPLPAAVPQSGGEGGIAGQATAPTPVVEPRQRFAEEVGLAVERVVGACDPVAEPPYMHLDERAWEEFQRLNPRRGAAAVPPIVLAGTLLVLWSRHAPTGPVLVSHTQALLGTVEVRDKNPTRGLKNCEWLQLRDGSVKLNPAKLEAARAVARAFCAGQRVSS